MPNLEDCINGKVAAGRLSFPEPHALADGMPADVQARFLEQMQHLDSHREAVARRYVAEGRV